MKYGKRILITLFCSIYIVSSVLTSYTTAYATAIPVPVTYTAYEVLEMLFLSLGISFDVLDIEIDDEELTDAVVYEVESFFESWMSLNGFDNPEQTRADLEACIEAGKDGVITVSDELWNALKGWASSLWAGSFPATEVDMSGLLSLYDYGALGWSDSFIAKFESYMSKYEGYTSCLVRVAENDGTLSYIFVYDFSYTPLEYKFEYRWTSEKGDFDLNNYYHVYKIVADSVGYRSVPAEYSQGLPNLDDENNTQILSDTKVVWDDCSTHCGGVAEILARNWMLEDAVDVIFPEESLAYDLCYLPDVDMDELWSLGAYDVITLGRTWDGTDVAGDVTLTFPEELTADIPFQDWYDDVVAGDIPYVDALTGIGVIAVDTDTDKALTAEGTIADAIIDSTISNAPTIEDTKEDVDENGETVTSDIPMTFDLSKLFPFCIPFDIIDFLAILSAEPEAPCITWPIQYPTLSGMETYELVIDLSQFDEVAALLRKMETIVFIVGLAGVTRSHMIKG